MARSALFYLSFHEPRRLRLPPGAVAEEPTVQDLRAALFDDEVSDMYCQRWWQEVGAPYAQVITSLADRGVRFHLSITGPLIRMLLQQYRKTRPFLRLFRHRNIAWVSVDPAHSLAFYLDIEAFARQLGKSRALARQKFAQVSVAAAAPHLCLNNEIYWSAASESFRAVLADGSDRVLGASLPGYLHRNGAGPYLCVRNASLSVKMAGFLGPWSERAYELEESSIAEGVLEQPGPLAFLGWHEPGVAPDPETRERNGPALLQRLGESLLAQGVAFASLGEVIDADGHDALPLALPMTTAPAAEFGDVSYFLGHPTQQSLFRLMQQSYSVAALSGNEEFVEMALDLAQWDVLELVHWLLLSNGSRQDPDYLTPAQWGWLGRDGVVAALHESYETFVRVVSNSFV